MSHSGLRKINTLRTSVCPLFNITFLLCLYKKSLCHFFFFFSGSLVESYLKCPCRDSYLPPLCAGLYWHEGFQMPIRKGVRCASRVWANHSSIFGINKMRAAPHHACPNGRSLRHFSRDENAMSNFLLIVVIFLKFKEYMLGVREVLSLYSRFF